MLRWLTVCAVLITSLASPTALGQNDSIRVEAQLEQIRVFAGVPVGLSVEVIGSTDARPVALIPPRGITIEYAGMTRMPSPITIINGQRLDSGPDRVRIRYQVTADQPGSQTIPAISVQVGGRVYKSEPIRFTALEPEEIRSAQVVLSVDNDTPYVGQPVRMTLTWYVGLRSNAIGVNGVIDSQQLELFTPQDDDWLTRARGSIDIRFLGDRAAWALERDVPHEGELWTAVSIQRIVVAHEPGEIELGPFTVIFDELGTLNTPGRRHIIRSNAVSLRVRSLPEDGRPADFSGLVGRCSVSASAQPTSVGVGDPITLTVHVDADEPVGRLSPPPLGPKAALRDGFKVSTEGWRLTEQTASGRTYQTTIRARSDRVTQIPPIEMPYFDVRAGAYRVARSEPIPIEVESRGEVTAEDAVIAASGGEPLPVPELGPEHLGLPANYPADESLRTTTIDAGRVLGSSPGMTVLLAPPGVWLGAMGVLAVRRHRRHPAFRRRRALARARRRLRGNPSPERIARAIRGYVADRFDVEAEAITTVDCQRLTGSTEHGSELAEVLARCDDPRYGGPAPATGEPRACEPARVLALVRTVDRELRSLA